jgi:hypothetical protein
MWISRSIARSTSASRPIRAVSLGGWVMCSVRGSQQHPIGGPLAPGETKVFPGPQGSIWSNGSPDPGALYDPEGRLVSYWPD